MGSSVPKVAKAYVQEAIKNSSAVLMDVREPSEIQRSGLIPTAHNVPLSQVKGALNAEPATFEQRYKFSKPEKSAVIIFYCAAGMRANQATSTAIGLGYENSVSYAGSYGDWAS